MSTRPRLRATLVALFVTVLWSSSWVLIRVGLDDELPPVTFAGLRYGLASVVLIGWVAARRRPVERPSRRDLPVLIALGIVMYALTQGAQFVAIDSQPAATTSLLLAMTPMLVAVSAATLLGEHTVGVQRIGAAVIIAGAAVYFAGDLGWTAVGLAAAIVGLLANTGAALLGRAVNRTSLHSPVVVTVVSMSIGAVILLAVGLAVEGWPRLTLTTVLIVAWLAVVNTALAFTLWNLALGALPASEMAAINTTMVIQIPLLGWIFLDEPLGPAEMAGIGLVALGVLAMQRRGAQPRAVSATVTKGV